MPTYASNIPTTARDSARSLRADQVGRPEVDIAGRLSKAIGVHKYAMWFEHADLRIDGERLEVATNSRFVADWIDKNFSPQLHDVARERLGDDASVCVHVDPAKVSSDVSARSTGACEGVSKPKRPADRGPSTRRAVSPRTQTRRRFRHSLEDYVVSGCNEIAFRAASRFAEDASACGAMLFIHGDCGLGKTHLLQGVCGRAAPDTRTRVRYVTGEQFTNEYIAAVRSNSIDDFRRRMRQVDLLAIDDVHFLANKMRTQDEFLHTLDAINLSGARVLLASDEHPRYINKLRESLVSRFLAGMVVQIERPDRAMREQLIKRLAARHNLTLRPAAIDLIAGQCVGSVRELQGVITKLVAIHEFGTIERAANGERSGEIGAVTVQRLFREQGWQTAASVRLSSIIETVCTKLAITSNDLMGASRHKRIVLGRALVAFLGRDLTTRSFPEIAAALGRKHHSTVHAAASRLQAQMEADVSVEVGQPAHLIALRELVDQLRHEIRRSARRSG